MPLLNTAKDVLLGDVPVKKVYRGAIEVWPPPSTGPVTIGQTSTDDNIGTSLAITLPPDYLDGLVLLLLQRNNSNINATADGGATLELVTRSSMSAAYLIRNPQPSHVVTFDTSHLNRLLAVTVLGASHALGSGFTGGNSTTSVIEMPPLGHQPATVDDLVVAVGGTNSSAIWTGPAGWDTVYQTPGGNASLGAWWSRPAAGSEGTTPPDADRGNDGAARNESAMTVLLSTSDRTPDVIIDDPAPGA